MLMLQPLLRYADFKGRARRAEYWKFVLFQTVVGFVLGFVGALAGKDSGLNLISNLFILAMWLPTLAVGVRRLHDINRTGWWLVLAPAVLAVTLILFISIKGAAMTENLGQLTDSNDPTALVKGATTAFGDLITWVVLPTWLAALVTFVFHVTDGTSGPNRFGPDPKSGSGVDISVFDDNRIDAAIDEARTAKRERDPDYKPIFDFTSPLPSSSASEAPASPAVTPAQSCQAPGRQTPSFGKRR